MTKHKDFKEFPDPEWKAFMICMLSFVAFIPALITTIILGYKSIVWAGSICTDGNEICEIRHQTELQIEKNKLQQAQSSVLKQ